MAEKTFTIANFDSKKDLGLILNDYTRTVIPDVAEQTVDIPGIRGQLYQGMDIGARTFTLDVTLLCGSEKDRVVKIRDLSNFFVQMMDGQEYPLKFGDESDITWWVHPTAISEPQRLGKSLHDVEFTITFKCSSGVGVGITREHELVSQTSRITPRGNTTTYPVFTYIGQEQTKIGISDGDDYIYIGKGFDVENQDAPVNMQPRILNDACNTLATWTALSSTSDIQFNIENGVISDDAAVRTTGNSLTVTLKDGDNYFGKNVEGKWHGPARMQWLSKSLTDYKITARMLVNNKYARAMGKVELYLLDQNGRRIGKIMVKDNDESLKNMVQVQIGYDSNGTSKDVYLSTRDGDVKVTEKSKAKKELKYQAKVKTTTTDKKGKKTTVETTPTKTMMLPQDLSFNTFTDFYGNISLTKKGDLYTVAIQKLDSNGNPIKKVYEDYFTDTHKIYGDKLAGIAIYFAKYDITEDKLEIPVKYKENTVQLNDVKVWELLGEEKQIIAEQGDEIIIDCGTNTVTKNGEPYMENLYIGSNFFDMTGDIQTAFSVNPPPDENNKWYLSYKERVN